MLMVRESSPEYVRMECARSALAQGHHLAYALTHSSRLVYLPPLSVLRIPLRAIIYPGALISE